MEKVARVGEHYSFTSTMEPQFNCILEVVEVLGYGPEDLVFFNDGTHSKQKHMAKVDRVVLEEFGTSATRL